MARFSAALLAILLAAVAPPALAQQGGIENLRQTGKAFASVAREVSPSVVFVRAERSVQGPETSAFQFPFGEQWPFDEDFFRRFFGDELPSPPPGEAPERERRAVGQGSGFVFQVEEGLPADKTYILTNNHVVADAEEILVTFEDGREFEAEVKGGDPQSDVAVIEINAGGLPALPLGDSSKLEVGEWVIAMGNPFGLSHTLTVGVVSAKGRTSLGISDYEDFIQTDAAINPGNSGGPLVNLSGEVVGINTAIFSRSGGYMGVGFAIPINLAKAIAEQLIAQGQVTRGYLGVVIQPLTQDLAESFGLERTRGILIAQVAEDSPAAEAGLRQGDVIVSYQDKPVTDVGDFRNRVSLTAPGSRQELVVMRDAERQTLEVTIGTLSGGQAVAGAPAEITQELGLTVQTLTPELAEQFDTQPGEGVVVTAVRPGSPAAGAGIEPGTIILQVNRQFIKDAADYRRAVSESREQRRVLLLVRRGEMQRYVVLTW